MNKPGFNHDRTAGTTSHSLLGKHWHSEWIRLSHIGNPAHYDLTGSRTGRIFAIVAPPVSADDGKIIRRILIFDNHPETLRLVFGGDGRAVFHVSAPQRVRSGALILGVILLVAIGLIGMFWPLL
jgi:hypothetical protein